MHFKQSPNMCSIVRKTCTNPRCLVTQEITFCTVPPNICSILIAVWATQWCSWLRHCTTSQKVTGLIPDGVTGIFHWLIPSSCTMALGLTQPLTEICARGIFFGGKGGWCRRLTTLPPSCADCLEILGASTSWSPKDLSRPAQG
jgi:hypothetical protein